MMRTFSFHATNIHIAFGIYLYFETESKKFFIATRDSLVVNIYEISADVCVLHLKMKAKYLYVIII